jgi:hypothetical protein
MTIWCDSVPLIQEEPKYLKKKNQKKKNIEIPTSYIFLFLVSASDGVQVPTIHGGPIPLKQEVF